MKKRNLFLLSASVLLSLATIGNQNHGFTKAHAEGELLAELNTVNSWMKPGFNYDLDNEELRSFKILVGVDISLKEIAETAEATNYGIYVSTQGKEVKFDFKEESSWKTGQGIDETGEKLYVVLELGDVTTDCVRLNTEFTAASYMTVGEDTIIANDPNTSLSVHTFEDLINAGAYDSIEAVTKLREDANSWHNFTTKPVTNTLGYELYETECSGCHETKYTLKTSAEVEPVAVNGAITGFTGAQIEMVDGNPFLAVSGTYVGSIDRADYRIGDESLKQVNMSTNTVLENYLTASPNSSVISNGSFKFLYDLNSINYHSGLWRQFTFAPSIFAYETKFDIKCDVTNTEDAYFLNADKNVSYKAYNGEANQVLVSWCNNQNDENNPKNEFKRGLDFMMHTYTHKMGRHQRNNHESIYLDIYGWVRREEEANYIENNFAKYKLASASTTSKTHHEFKCISANHETANTNDGYVVNLRFDVHDFRFDTNTTILGLKYDGLWYQKRSSSATFGGDDGLLKLKNLTSTGEYDAGHECIYYRVRNFCNWAELYVHQDFRGENYVDPCPHLDA